MPVPIFDEIKEGEKPSKEIAIELIDYGYNMTCPHCNYQGDLIVWKIEYDKETVYDYLDETEGSIIIECEYNSNRVPMVKIKQDRPSLTFVHLYKALDLAIAKLTLTPREEVMRYIQGEEHEFAITYLEDPSLLFTLRVTFHANHPYTKGRGIVAGEGITKSRIVECLTSIKEQFDIFR